MAPADFEVAMNGAGGPTEAGSQTASTLTSANGVNTADILTALETIHDPRTDNTIRRHASNYLEQLKAGENAVQLGYTLGSDGTQQVLVRHFGLSILEHVVRHEWHKLSEDQGSQLRQCVVELGKSMTQSGPPFLRNKIAELWIELAKRSWALDWFDLDDILTRIWAKDVTSKEFVLIFLENLSEDVFVREDPGAVLRGRDLSTALVNIFTSSSEHTGDIKIGPSSYTVRSGDEGWLSRISQFLTECLRSDLSSPQVKSCIINVLATLRSVFSWVITTSISSSGCLTSICNCFSKQDTDILMVCGSSLVRFPHADK
jgi:exportin-5